MHVSCVRGALGWPAVDRARLGETIAAVSFKITWKVKEPSGEVEWTGENDSQGIQTVSHQIIGRIRPGLLFEWRKAGLFLSRACPF